MIKRKGQEEMVGFVLIVVIVSVLILIFLAIFIRNDGNETHFNSAEVIDFLEGSREYTTTCALSFEPDYLRLGELLRECNNGRQCLSGESVCEVLNVTLTNMIESSWRFGEDRALKGYSFNSTYYQNNSRSDSREVFYIAKGNCSGAIKGGEDIAPDYPGNIITRMLLCY